VANIRWGRAYILNVFKHFEAKTYPDNKSVTYTYTPGGRLHTRRWARGVTTTYEYNPAGEMASLVYSDGTPGATYSYDARGRRIGITDGAGTRTLATAEDGQPLSESWSGGVLDTVAVANSYNPLHLRSGMDASVGGTSIADSTLTYDAASRLVEVAQGSLKATTAYAAPLQTVGSIAFQSGNATLLTTRPDDMRKPELPAAMAHRKERTQKTFRISHGMGSHSDSCSESSRYWFPHQNRPNSTKKPASVAQVRGN
jgi:YD repeat-containing protein